MPVPTRSTPRLRIVQQSQLDDDSYHSVLLSLLRGLAGLQVAAAHLRAEFMPGLRTLDNPTLWYQVLAFFTGFAHHAVVVFFVISGWLVGGSYLNKRHHPGALQLYAIDRATRLWTVLVPAFLLSLSFGILSGELDPRSVDFSSSNAYSVTSFAGNLLGLQTVTLPKFGDNYPLWSLANETWYYLMFPLLVAAFTSERRLASAACLALCALLLPLEMVAYFSIWLMGAAFSRVRLECGAATRIALGCAVIGLSVLIRFKGVNDDMTMASFPQDLMLSLVVLLFLSSTVVKPVRPLRALALVRSAGTLLSNFSFTLYVVHIPLMGIIGWLGVHLLGTRQIPPDHWTGLLIYTAVLAAVVVVSYAFYQLFEANTHTIRRWVKERLLAAGATSLARPR